MVTRGQMPEIEFQRCQRRRSPGGRGLCRKRRSLKRSPFVKNAKRRETRRERESSCNLLSLTPSKTPQELHPAYNPNSRLLRFRWRHFGFLATLQPSAILAAGWLVRCSASARPGGRWSEASSLRWNAWHLYRPQTSLSQKIYMRVSLNRATPESSIFNRMFNSINSPCHDMSRSLWDFPNQNLQNWAQTYSKNFDSKKVSGISHDAA